MPRRQPAPTAIEDWSGSFPLAEKRGLTAETLKTYVRARRTMRSDQLVEAVGHMRGAAATSPFTRDEQLYVSLRLAGVVTRVLARLPTDSRCLVTALTLTGMLASRGVESELVVGVRSEPEFAAHAWVELDGRAVLPPGDEFMERLVTV